MFKKLISYLTILGLSFILIGCNSSSSGGSSTKKETSVLSANPAGGTYNNAQSVTLSAEDESATTIYYTIDGSTPDESSTSYTESIVITANTTLKAIAIDATGNKSEELTEVYTIDTTKPVLSANPAGGTYNNAQSVTLSAEDESATTIYYTIDGSTPDESSTSYTESIVITANTTLRAIAIDVAGNKSEELTEVYTIDTTKPVLSANPAGGTYNNAQSVTLSAEDESATTIYYTIDGSTPDESSTSYTESIVITANTTLKAIAIDATGNKSEELTEVYTIDTTKPVLSANPAGGAYNNAQSVTLSAEDESATTIYYTIDGSTPDESSTSYTESIVITANTTLKAIAIDATGNKSEELTEVYTIDTTKPVLSANPAGGTYNNAQSVTLSAEDESATTIYYTIDGSTPDESSTSYTESIVITANTTLRAIAIDVAGNKSNEINEVYTIDTTPPVLSANPAGGTYNNAQSVTLSAEDESATTIYYTLDGSTPSENSAVYERPISIEGIINIETSIRTLRAIATDNVGNRSNEVNERYVIEDVIAPTVTITVDQTTGKIILTADESATIYYTLDGTDPSTESMVYTMPFSLSEETTVKSFAVDTVGNNGEIVFKTYIVTFSLEQNYISSNNISKTKDILLDSHGNLWFTSDGQGINKYDGSDWTNYTVQNTGGGLVSNIVYTITEDSEGNLWFGTNGGVSKYDGNDWVDYTVQNTGGGLVSNIVRDIFKDKKGYLWFATAGGVSKYDGSGWTNYTIENSDLVNKIVNVITEDKDGNLWFGTISGASKYNGSNTWVSYIAQDTGLAHDNIEAIIKDTNDNLWFATSGGVSKYDGSDWTNYTVQNTGGGLVSNIVYTITEDSEGNLWFGTTSGASKYDGSGWTSYTTENGLKESTIYSIAEDIYGNLWFGNPLNFVEKFDGSNWSVHNTLMNSNELQSNKILSSFKDSAGNLWFGTAGSISRYDGNTWATYTAQNTDNSLVGEDIKSIFEDREGNLWFGMGGGSVSKYNGNTWTSYTKENTDDGLTQYDVNAIMEDKDDNLWFATSGGGVRKYDGNTWTSYTRYNTNLDLRSDFILDIIKDKDDNLWFGTSNGANKYDGNTWTGHNLINSGDSFISNSVNAIYEDSKDNLWFGTSLEGASKYDGSFWMYYTTVDGLKSNYVSDIIEDSRGNLWFATNNGISRYNGSIWTNYTSENGLKNNNVKTILEDNNGKLWFGTDGGGISKFRYSLPVEKP